MDNLEFKSRILIGESDFENVLEPEVWYREVENVVKVDGERCVFPKLGDGNLKTLEDYRIHTNAMAMFFHQREGDFMRVQHLQFVMRRELQIMDEKLHHFKISTVDATFVEDPCWFGRCDCNPSQCDQTIEHLHHQVKDLKRAVTKFIQIYKRAVADYNRVAPTTIESITSADYKRIDDPREIDKWRLRYLVYELMERCTLDFHWSYTNSSRTLWATVRIAEFTYEELRESSDKRFANYQRYMERSDGERGMVDVIKKVRMEMDWHQQIDLVIQEHFI